MDKVIPVSVSFAGYLISAGLISSLVRTPESLSRKEQKDHLGRYLSVLHAYVAVFLSSAVYIYEGGVDYNAPTNSLHLKVMAVIPTQNSLGYFIFDSVYSEFFHLNDAAMRMHHVFVLVGLLTLFLSTYGGSSACCNL